MRSNDFLILAFRSLFLHPWTALRVICSWTPQIQVQPLESPSAWISAQGAQLPRGRLLGIAGVSPGDSSKSPRLWSFHHCPNSITFCLKFSGVCFKHRILICTVNESHGKNEERDKTEGKRAVGKRSCKRWGKGSGNYNWWIRWHPQLLTVQINMKLSRRKGKITMRSRFKICY